MRELFQEVTQLFEPVSIDEAYLDLSEDHRRCDKPPAVLLAQLPKKSKRKLALRSPSASPTISSWRNSLPISTSLAAFPQSAQPKL